MDPNYNPKAPAGKIKIGENILEQENSEIPVHEPLTESVKHGASVYDISQAFQKGLPGINQH